jgi:hypothetical protein
VSGASNAKQGNHGTPPCFSSCGCPDTRGALLGFHIVLISVYIQAAEEVFRKEEADKRKELAERFQTLVADFTKRMEAHMESSKALTEENHV